MEFHWLDLFYWLQLFEIYYKNSPPSDECLQMLIEAQQNLATQNNEYKNSVLEDFIKKNKCCTSN